MNQLIRNQQRYERRLSLSLSFSFVLQAHRCDLNKRVQAGLTRTGRFPATSAVKNGRRGEGRQREETSWRRCHPQQRRIASSIPRLK